MNKLLGGVNKKLIRILVIDDSEIIQRVLKSFLQDLDIEVITCSNGLEGIQVAVETKPSLIFLDLMMPNLDGIKMLQLKQVLADIKNIPVIIISANANKQNVFTAIELGATKVISKPLQKDVILKALKEVFQEELFSTTNDKHIYENGYVELPTQDQEKAQSDFQNELVKMFLSNFSNQKKQIVGAIGNKDKRLIKSVTHDIKGAGGTIGYNQISEIASVIQDREINSDFDWFFVQVKCEQLFKEVRKIEDLIFGSN
ncbi:MAG: response regulator [Ignavibacteriales bacterium]|nr:response regulator [Ignavibacteriales bacterium]